MLPLRICDSRVMSENNRNQGSVMEEIWRGGIRDKGCVSVCVSFCVTGLFGFDEGVEGRAIICALSGALRLTHSQGCVSPTVDSPHKGQRRVSTCNLMPDPWGGERFLFCTWQAFSTILWRSPVFSGLVLSVTQNQTPHSSMWIIAWKRDLCHFFLYACLCVWDRADRNCVVFLSFLPPLWN